VNIQEYEGRPLQSVFLQLYVSEFQDIMLQAGGWLYLQTSLRICTNCEVELQVLRRACVWGSGVPIPLTNIKKEEAGTKGE
jgi:hypothetical protein